MSEEKSQKKESKKKSKDKDKLKQFDPRGLQTLFRTLSRNHYNLLRMVDNKASIILTMNSIIITLLMAVIYMAPEDSDGVLELGSKILLNFGMASMVFALLAMLPHKYIKLGSDSSAYKGSLYAQNFSKMTLEQYRKEMQRVMATGHSVYNEMIDDLYFLGKSVSIKQKLIMISVGLFLLGLIISIINTLYHGVMIEKLFFDK